MKRFEHIELPAKLLDYFLQSNKSNINQTVTKIKKCEKDVTSKWWSPETRFSRQNGIFLLQRKKNEGGDSLVDVPSWLGPKAKYTIWVI